MPIPQPKTFGPLGNLPLIDKESPTLSLCRIAEEYGPIFLMEFYGGFSTIFLSGHELVAEVCNDSKFDKSLLGGLSKVRAFSGDGLFTSKTREPNWQKAHNILVPSFSQQAMKGYHSMMVDIAQQLVQKWERLNHNESIDVPDDMTRLTLDTIGLCGFGYRFNSFYRENHNPFIISMVHSLDEAMHQGTRLPIQNKLMYKRKKQFDKDIQSMFSLVDQLIAERKERGDQGETDMLARMLSAKDPQTSETLNDENIRFQIITFLIAGHETTSGLLSFALYLLVKKPEVLKKAYEEVDQTLTSPIPTYKQVTQLKYIRMILNESLRLYPTAPQFTLYAKEDTVLGGKYQIKQKQNVAILLPQLHRDKEAWGEDVEEFRPERFEDPSKIPHDAFKPFGNGQRACIGMQFALHEAALLLGMILQKFELIDHTNYQLKIKQTMTLKPNNFTMRVQLRDKKAMASSVTKPVEHAGLIRSSQIPNAPIIGINNRPLLVLYGSNMGTAEGIAYGISERASSYGIKSEVAPLDRGIDNLPTDGAVLIITSSYNGKPPKNARRFVNWLEQLETGQLTGVQYAVFGCGDTNWANTYQDVPRFIDEQLALKGASRFSVRGEADVSGDIEEQLQSWKKSMWSDAMKFFGLTHPEQYEFDPSKLSIQYVDEVTDSVGVFPSNSRDKVNRILRRFRLNGNDQVILSTKGEHLSHFPLNQTVSLYELLSDYIDLQTAATAAQIRELAEYTICPPHKRELEYLLQDGMYEEQIVNKQVSMLDLLEKYDACEMPFERYLELLPPLEMMAAIV